MTGGRLSVRVAQGASDGTYVLPKCVIHAGVVNKAMNGVID